MYEIIIEQQDLDKAWKPATEAARLYHGPLNSAIARAFHLPMQNAYSKVGYTYFAVSIAGDYAMYDILEAHAAEVWGKAFDDGLPVTVPITFHAVLVSQKKGMSAARTGIIRQYGKDIETRRLRPDSVSTTSVLEDDPILRNARSKYRSPGG
jgi:hypothetical protein